MDDSRAGAMEIGMLVAESPKSSKIKLGTFFRKKGKADSCSDRGVCKKPGSCAVAQEATFAVVHVCHELAACLWAIP